MPLYDYHCHGCGQTFEVRQKFADKLLTVHENCGGELERMISLPALQFKGKGWYVTDYGKNGKVPSENGGQEKSESKSDSKSESKSDSKSESKSDSKSESKSESKSDSKSESKPESKSGSKSESKPSPSTSSTDK